MNHSFNVNVANLYGIEEAILLENIYFWCQKNKANEKHIINGKVWTYNSAKAFAEQFPYMTESKIYRTLKKLEDNGLIETGEFNNTAYDRTKWYTVTDKACFLLGNRFLTDDESILQNEKWTSQDCKNNISDINTDIKPNINIVAEATRPKKAPLVDREPANDLEKVEKAYLINYRKLYNSGIVKTESPVINWGQSRALTKKAIETYGLETILDAVQKSVDYDFCVQKGYALTTILSAGCLANLINGNNWKKGAAITDFDRVSDDFSVMF